MSKTTENYVNKPNMASLLTKIDTKMNNRYTKDEIDEYIPKTFVGTTAEWNSLSAAVKANYTLVTLTDDFVNAGVVSQLEAEIATKQDALTFDSTPTNGSSNPVTSDGVYDALSAKQNKLTGLLTTGNMMQYRTYIELSEGPFVAYRLSNLKTLFNNLGIDTSKPVTILLLKDTGGTYSNQPFAVIIDNIDYILDGYNYDDYYPVLSYDLTQCFITKVGSPATWYFVASKANSESVPVYVRGYSL